MSESEFTASFNTSGSSPLDDEKLNKAKLSSKKEELAVTKEQAKAELAILTTEEKKLDIAAKNLKIQNDTNLSKTREVKISQDKLRLEQLISQASEKHSASMKNMQQQYEQKSIKFQQHLEDREEKKIKNEKKINVDKEKSEKKITLDKDKTEKKITQDKIKAELKLKDIRKQAAQQQRHAYEDFQNDPQLWLSKNMSRINPALASSLRKQQMHTNEATRLGMSTMPWFGATMIGMSIKGIGDSILKQYELKNNPLPFMMNDNLSSLKYASPAVMELSPLFRDIAKQRGISLVNDTSTGKYKAVEEISSISGKSPSETLKEMMSVIDQLKMSKSQIASGKKNIIMFGQEMKGFSKELVANKEILRGDVFTQLEAVGQAFTRAANRNDIGGLNQMADSARARNKIDYTATRESTLGGYVGNLLQNALADHPTLGTTLGTAFQYGGGALETLAFSTMALSNMKSLKQQFAAEREGKKNAPMLAAEEKKLQNRSVFNMVNSQTRSGKSMLHKVRRQKKVLSEANDVISKIPKSSGIIASGRLSGMGSLGTMGANMAMNMFQMMPQAGDSGSSALGTLGQVISSAAPMAIMGGGPVGWGVGIAGMAIGGLMQYFDSKQQKEKSITNAINGSTTLNVDKDETTRVLKDILSTLKDMKTSSNNPVLGGKSNG